MPMAEQIRDEINAPPRYDSKLQTRPALEAVNTGEHAMAWTLTVCTRSQERLLPSFGIGRLRTASVLS